MRPRPSPLQTWLRRRIRIACVAVLVVSFFAPIYQPDFQASADETDISIDSDSLALVEDGFVMKSSTLTELGSRSAFSQGIIHTVEPNESIASIARMSYVKTETIRWANGLKEGEPIKPGQKLLILPVDGVVHTVRKGENLKMIAELYGVDSQKISDQNKLKGGYLLAGQQLIVPGGTPIVPGFAAIIPKNLAGRITAPTPSTPTVSTPSQGTVKAPPQDYSITPTNGILQRPCDCYVTQGYTGYHYGIDMQHKGGSPVFAAEAGTVIRADYGWNGGYGNVVEIDHGNGIVTLYAHNKELYVKKGDIVARGQNISFMGNTGLVHGPTGIHLHFEVQVNGVKRNPNLYLKE